MTGRSPTIEARRDTGELLSSAPSGRCDAAELEVQIAALAGLLRHDLAVAWRRWCRGDPPHGWSRDLLRREIAYQMQERVYGGLNVASRRRLRTLITQIDSNGSAIRDLGIALKPGARLVREWGGQTHIVLVQNDGFDYDGERFGSLSLIARRITGARWSGPRFFGLTGRRAAGEHRDG